MSGIDERRAEAVRWLPNLGGAALYKIVGACTTLGGKY